MKGEGSSRGGSQVVQAGGQAKRVHLDFVDSTYYSIVAQILKASDEEMNKYLKIFRKENIMRIFKEYLSQMKIANRNSDVLESVNSLKSGEQNTKNKFFPSNQQQRKQTVRQLIRATS